MASRATTRKRETKTNETGRRLMEGVRQMHHAAATGDYTGMRVHQLDIPDPGQYRAKGVRALRDTLGVTQRTFARLLGVSPELIEHWEQGLREPSPLARRLLDRIKADPAVYLADLLERREIASPARDVRKASKRVG